MLSALLHPISPRQNPSGSAAPTAQSHVPAFPIPGNLQISPESHKNSSAPRGSSLASAAVPPPAFRTGCCSAQVLLACSSPQHPQPAVTNICHMFALSSLPGGRKAPACVHTQPSTCQRRSPGLEPPAHSGGNQGSVRWLQQRQRLAWRAEGTDLAVVCHPKAVCASPSPQSICRCPGLPSVASCRQPGSPCCLTTLAHRAHHCPAFCHYPVGLLQVLGNAGVSRASGKEEGGQCGARRGPVLWRDHKHLGLLREAAPDNERRDHVLLPGGGGCPHCPAVTHKPSELSTLRAFSKTFNNFLLIQDCKQSWIPEVNPAQDQSSELTC